MKKKERVTVDNDKVIKVNPKMIREDFEKSIMDALQVKSQKGRIKIPEIEELTISEVKYLIETALKLKEYLHSATKKQPQTA